MKRTIIVVATIAAAALSVTALAQRAKDAEILFHKGVHLEEAQGDLKAAIESLPGLPGSISICFSICFCICICL